MSDILPLPTFALPRFGSIHVSGVDARDFLQGQLSFDMSRLTSQRIELASCNSPQGRVQALVWMVERTDGIFLILPDELVDATMHRLRKYVLRARVKIESGVGRLLVGGANIAPELDSPRAHTERDGVSFVRWPGITDRTLVLAPASVRMNAAETFHSEWKLADIRAGLPQIYLSTRELFVAQMLNVDLLEGISFEKGCYTGQEIIARTHFRGKVKRRMFAFEADCAPPAPATRVISGDAHAGDVVDAVATSGGCELLAVVSLSDLGTALTLADAPACVLRRMALPYAVDVG